MARLLEISTPCVTAFQVPAVDISPYTRGGTPEARAEAAAAIDTACREVGFIQIIGHRIAPQAHQGLM